jgi:hypothetical protein
MDTHTSETFGPLAVPAAVVTTGAALTSYGFTEAQANSLIALVNALRATIVAQGIGK